MIHLSLLCVYINVLLLVLVCGSRKQDYAVIDQIQKINMNTGRSTERKCPRVCEKRIYVIEKPGLHNCRVISVWVSHQECCVSTNSNFFMKNQSSNVSIIWVSKKLRSVSCDSSMWGILSTHFIRVGSEGFALKQKENMGDHRPVYFGTWRELYWKRCIKSVSCGSV